MARSSAAIPIIVLLLLVTFFVLGLTIDRAWYHGAWIIVFILFLLFEISFWSDDVNRTSNVLYFSLPLLIATVLLGVATQSSLDNTTSIILASIGLGVFTIWAFIVATSVLFPVPIQPEPEIRQSVGVSTRSHRNRKISDAEIDELLSVNIDERF